jgi:hypothetical protein
MTMTSKTVLASIIALGLGSQIAFAALNVSAAKYRAPGLEAAGETELEAAPAPEVVPSERAISLLRQARRHTVRVVASDAQSLIGANGGGFVIHRFGALAVVATNAHVVLGEDRKLRSRFTVSNEAGTQLTAYPLTWRLDPLNADYALLVVHDAGQALGDSVKLAAPKPGAFVVCVGHPLGESFLASKGHITAIRGPSVNHDCISERGSSGGPVFDSSGSVVAIQTYVHPTDGAGTALDTAPLRTLALEHARVQADQGWQDIGIDAAVGSSLLATGSWTYSGWYGSTTAFGNDDGDLSGYSVNPALPHAALLCRVGAIGEPFAVNGRWQGTGAGPTAVKQLHGNGTLWCRPNDRDVKNNGGALDVVLVSE